jgi:hypothetical protein
MGAYMNRAIGLAKIALTTGDTRVGFLGGTRGKIIAEGVEAVKRMMDVSAHAERFAIRNACLALRTLDLSGCVLYTTVGGISSKSCSPERSAVFGLGTANRHKCWSFGVGVYGSTVSVRGNARLTS